MKTSIHETLAELHDFVVIQAEEDAVLDPEERRYQADLVADVLTQEPLKPEIIKSLVSEYKDGVARQLEAIEVAA